MLPIVSLVNERNSSRTASTEEDSINRNALRIFPSRINYRALTSGCAKSNKKEYIRGRNWIVRVTESTSSWDGLHSDR